MYEGFDKNLRKIDGNQTKRDNFTLAADWDMQRERTPLANPVQIHKGELTSTMKGVVTFYDKTGGTVVFQYDPAVGTIEFTAPVTMNQVMNLGTIISPVIQGTMSVAGLITGGTMGVFTGGTLNNVNLGTPTIKSPTYQGSAVYPLGTAIGTMYMQDNGLGTPQMIMKYGTTNFYFNPTGTL